MKSSCGMHVDKQKPRSKYCKRQELYAHGMRNKYGNIKECNCLQNQYTRIHHPRHVKYKQTYIDKKNNVTKIYLKSSTNLVSKFC